MEIKELSLDEVKNLYETKMRQDFPPAELRPYRSIHDLSRQGNYLCFGCLENGSVAAYAYFALAGRAALLDYLAVDAGLRGRGVGGKFLQGLRNLPGRFAAPGFLIEVESVENAETPEQVEERQRRIRFYLHCGCVETQVYSYLFGVEYRIYYLPLGEAPLSDDEIKSALESVYRIIVPPLVEEGEEAYREVCRCYFRP